MGRKKDIKEDSTDLPPGWQRVKRWRKKQFNKKGKWDRMVITNLGENFTHQQRLNDYLQQNGLSEVRINPVSGLKVDHGVVPDNNHSFSDDTAEITKHSDDEEQCDDVPKIVVHDATVTDATEERSESPDERSESPDELPASPANQYFTAPSSRRTTDLGRVPSPTFDTTQDEMALFEMFGEDYDDIVAAMSHEERVQLGEKLANRGEQEMLEVAQKLRHMMKDRTSSVGSSLPPVIIEEEDQSIGSDVSPFSLTSSTNVTPSPNIVSEPASQHMDVDTIGENLNNSHITSPPSKKINLLDTPTVFKTANMSRTEDLVQSPIFSYPNNLSFDEPSSVVIESTQYNDNSDDDKTY